MRTMAFIVLGLLNNPAQAVTRQRGAVTLGRRRRAPLTLLFLYNNEDESLPLRLARGKTASTG